MNAWFPLPDRAVGPMLLAALGSTACVSSSVAYQPEEWKQYSAEQVGDCPAIAGVFVDVGTRGESLGESDEVASIGPVSGSAAAASSPLLSLLLSGESLGDHATVVAITQPDANTLQLTAPEQYGGNGKVVVLRRDQDDFSCDSKGLRLEKPEAPMIMGVVNGFRSTRLAFRRGTDGSILMSVEERDTLVMILTPFLFRDTTYVRWSPATGQLPTSSSAGLPQAAQPDQIAGSQTIANEANPLFTIVLNGKTGFIDKTGTMVIAPQFSAIEASSEVFPEGLAAVMIGGMWGFIDKSGTMVISPQFVDAFGFSEGLAVVGVITVGEKMGAFIDKNGQMVIPPRYDGALSFTDGLAAVSIGGKWGYIDKAGTMAIAPQFTDAWGFSEGLAAVKAGGKWGFIDKSGQMVIPPRYAYSEDPSPFSEGLEAVQVGGKWGFIDKGGQMVIPPRYSAAHGFTEGLVGVKTGGKWGYMDKTGTMVIAPQFSEAWKFSEGLAAVKVGGKWGFIDKSGQMVIPPRYSAANSFYEGLVSVKNDGSWGYIDKTGKYVWEQRPGQ